MGRPRGPGTRVLSLEDRGGSGPKRFRVRYLLDGRPVSVGFATAREAAAVVARIEKLAAVRPEVTVQDTIARWLDDRRAQKLPVYPYYERWVSTVLADELGDPIATITPKVIADNYRAKTGHLAVATAKLALICLKVFGGYLVEQKLIGENPAAGLKNKAQAKKGKARIETRRETLAFMEEAFRRAREGDRVALGVLLGLFLGLRSGEVRALEARHVDLDRVIRVPGTKTENAPRPVRVVSDELWELVDSAARAGGRLVPYGWKVLVTRTKQIGRAANVANADQLVFHSLRGMAASLALEGGAAEAAIASALGHASFEVTAAHYASAESKDAAASRTRMTVLRGGKSG
jgi:integrase